MHFQKTEFSGGWLIKPELVEDERGFFARTFCAGEFTERGLVATFAQHRISSSRTTGTLRGMHFQRPPHQEVKLVTCLKGAIWDVVIDLRQDSPTFARWQGFELTATNRRRLYIPQGFAHGHDGGSGRDAGAQPLGFTGLETPAVRSGVRERPLPAHNRRRARRWRWFGPHPAQAIPGTTSPTA